MSSTTTTHGMKKRLASGLLAASILMGGGVLSASPALAAGTIKVHAASDYASASTSTNNGWAGRSYARHGNLVAGWTPWTLSSSSAYADSGTSSTYVASGQVGH